MTSFSPPVEIAAWLACLSFLAFLFNQCARAWFTLRGKPSPEEQAERTAGISERVAGLERGATERDRRIEKLEAGLAAMRELINSENDKIFKAVNAVAEDTNVMRGELKGVKDNLALLLQRSIK